MTDEPLEQLAFIPQIDTDGTPYVRFVWGSQDASFRVEDALGAGYSLMEAAVDAQLQGDMARWLLTQPDADAASIGAIIRGFRTYRASVRTLEASPPEGDPIAAT